MNDQLADAETTAMGSVREEAFALAGNHEELCKLEESPGKPSAEVQQWLNLALSKESLQPIRRRMHPSQ